jgi:cubilin
LVFANRPKIFVNDGNLVFESAESRNISIKLKGKSRFLINNIDLLRILNPSNSTSFENSLTASTTDFDELRDQVKSIKNIIRGRDGILKRLERLENGNTPTNSNSTSSQTAQQDRRRINALQRRVVTLESRVANLTERLTKDYCKTYPCQNGGTCFNMFETFRCECPKNWEGPTCSLDVDECSKYLGTEFACQNGATCINKPGSFE